MGNPALEIEDLTVGFPAARGWLDVVRGISLSVAAGEIVALVGESGSGKSLISLSCLALTPAPGRILEGHVRVGGRDLLTLAERALGAVRGGEIGVVFQEPLASFDPRWSMTRHLEDVLVRHTALDSAQRRVRQRDLLELVALPHGRLDAFAHELSGGERQRMMIALALAGDPQVLVADEPTSALDTTVRSQIADLIVGLRDRLGLAVLLTTHDFGLVARVADRVVVVTAGRVVEAGSREQILESPRHPYTQALLESIVWFGEGAGPTEAPLLAAPSVASLPRGCPFHPRCGRAVDRCRDDEPELESRGEGHFVACWRDRE